MFKKIFILIAALALGTSLIFAQGNGPGGNGNGRGNGQQQGDPQMNAYRNGGIGFVNAEDGTGWNGNQRGRMGRGAGQNGVGYYAMLPPASVDELPQNVIDLMIGGWTDEQNAYATYESIMTQFGEVRPFVNIQQAEAQHIAAWEFLFDRYNIDIPALPQADIPQFASTIEACQLGAQAEIVNFGLYDEMLVAFADYPDIYQVALSLRNASEFNHLPAFERCG